MASTGAPPKKPRTIIYVDGFNFFYGAIKGSPNYWLNLERFFLAIRQHDDVRRIHYFTALVFGRDRPAQEVYLKALSTLPLVNVVLGKYKTKRLLCNVSACTHGGVRHFETWEEKRSDVSIAVQMIDDAYQDACDNFVLVSGDSDLVPALHLIKLRYPEKQLIVYVPTRNKVRGAAYELRGAADKHQDIPLALLKHCHFPSQIKYTDGSVLTKPSSWK